MRFDFTRSLALFLAPGTLGLLWACSGADIETQAVGSGSQVSAGTTSGGAGAASDGGSPSATGGSGSSAGSGSSSSSAGITGSGGSATSGSGEFPCEVQAMLASKCQSCHRVDPPGTLLSAADFSRASRTDPQKTVGQVALDRLQATGATRMPPAPLDAATAAEIAALTSWVQAGAKPTTCGDTPVPTAPDPYDTPVVCSSMKNWTGGNRESPLMRPGNACISCHAQGGEGPRFAVAGTVYPTPHEPNDCNGITSASGAEVVITEANGTSHTLDVNDAGNFFLQARSFSLPYQAKVVYQGKEREMLETQQSGDCNDCHTEAGTKNAPGRIFLP